MIKFANGSSACHTLVLGAMKANRTIHIVGTKGEIEGSVVDGELFVRTFDKNSSGCSEKRIDFTEVEGETGGHFGGDKGLVKDLLSYLKGAELSISTTAIDDSLVGHLIVYDADKSVIKGGPVIFDHNV